MQTVEHNNTNAMQVKVVSGWCKWNTNQQKGSAHTNIITINTDAIHLGHTWMQTNRNKREWNPDRIVVNPDKYTLKYKWIQLQYKLSKDRNANKIQIKSK